MDACLCQCYDYCTSMLTSTPILDYITSQAIISPRLRMNLNLCDSPPGSGTLRRWCPQPTLAFHPHHASRGAKTPSMPPDAYGRGVFKGLNVVYDEVLSDIHFLLSLVLCCCAFRS